MLPFHQQMIKQDVGKIMSGEDLGAARKKLLENLAALGLEEALLRRKKDDDQRS
jgi:hypothetical protein